MKHFILVLTFGIIAQCNAGTFAPDTITNFQIYNGGKLLLAGLAPDGFDEFQDVAVKRSELRDLEIQFNYCMHETDLDVTIEIKDDKGKKILSKKFKVDSGARMRIEKKELGRLTAPSFTIKYVERRGNGEKGMNKVLGRILLE